MWSLVTRDTLQYISFSYTSIKTLHLFSPIRSSPTQNLPTYHLITHSIATSNTLQKTKLDKQNYRHLSHLDAKQPQTARATCAKPADHIRSDRLPQALHAMTPVHTQAHGRQFTRCCRVICGCKGRTNVSARIRRSAVLRLYRLENFAVILQAGFLEDE